MCRKRCPNRASAPLEPEGSALGSCVQDWLVDDVVVPVAASHGFEAIDSQLCEKGSVRALDLCAPVECIFGTAHDIAVGVGREPLNNRL